MSYGHLTFDIQRGRFKSNNKYQPRPSGSANVSKHGRPTCRSSLQRTVGGGTFLPARGRAQQLTALENHLGKSQTVENTCARRPSKDDVHAWTPAAPPR